MPHLPTLLARGARLTLAGVLLLGAPLPRAAAQCAM